MKKEKIIINKKLGFLILISTILFAGCASSEFDDINVWMKQQENSLKGKIDPLPEAKKFTPVAFSAPEDPFVQKPTLSLSDLDKDKYAPDPNRRKEPLEAYPLESLRMTGSIYKEKQFFAIIKSSDGIVHYVTVGNYMGNNYGKIVGLEEGQITLDERVKDSSDQWKPQTSTVFLDDGDGKK